MWFKKKYTFQFILLAFFTVLLTEGCSYKKRKILFKTDKEIETSKEQPIIVLNEQNYSMDHECKNGDVIEVRLLNEQGDKTAYDKLTTTREDAKFTVHDSLLTLPIVGKVNVFGLKKGEVISKLEKEYSKHIIDPIIDVEFVSLTVNVLGEVEIPGKYQFREGMNLIDGLGLAGGFTSYGIFKNVKIIRGKGEAQEIIVIDITSINSLNHPKLTLKDQDIIYVEPRKVKQFDNTVRPYLFLTSIVSSAAALFIVIIRSQ